MTYQELIDQIETFNDDKRKYILSELLKTLSPLSQNDLYKFQIEWDGNKSFEEFKISQNQLIKELVKLECSQLGLIIRKEFGMEKIDLNTNFFHITK